MKYHKLKMTIYEMKDKIGTQLKTLQINKMLSEKEIKRAEFVCWKVLNNYVTNEQIMDMYGFIVYCRDNPEGVAKSFPGGIDEYIYVNIIHDIYKFFSNFGELCFFPKTSGYRKHLNANTGRCSMNNKYLPYQLKRLKRNLFIYIFANSARATMKAESMDLCARNCLAKPNLKQWIFNPSRITNQKFIKEFENGSKVLLLTGNPSILIGKNGNLIINDFDLRSDQEEVYHIAFPLTTWGGKLEIFCCYDYSSSENTFLSRLIQGDKEDNNMT